MYTCTVGITVGACLPMILQRCWRCKGASTGVVPMVFTPFRLWESQSRICPSPLTVTDSLPEGESNGPEEQRMWDQHDNAGVAYPCVARRHPMRIYGRPNWTDEILDASTLMTSCPSQYQDEKKTSS